MLTLFIEYTFFVLIVVSSSNSENAVNPAQQKIHILNALLNICVQMKRLDANVGSRDAYREIERLIRREIRRHAGTG